MTAYQKMMEQITVDQDTLREKAAQMQAQAAHGKIRQHRTGKHRLLRITAAAAAVLVFGTVTVGAVNNWDYKGIFTKYFSSKSEEEIEYDFTGMGIDLGDVIQGDGYTITYDALLADTDSVYLAYHYNLSNDLEQQTAYPELFADTENLMADLITADSEPFEFTGVIGGENAERGTDGAYHGIFRICLKPDTTLQDKQIKVTFKGTERTYPLTDITVRKGVHVPYGGTLPNDTNENVFDTMKLTPFTMEFETVRSGSLAKPLYWGRAYGDDVEPLNFTAVYADGTEQPIKLAKGWLYSAAAGASLEAGTTDSYTYSLQKSYYFASPVEMEGLTAVRINGTEIPIQ